ncbi:MAG TPA: 6-phosphogluconolactonase [Chitinophagaceae bacterium]|nr:6-phosphogluconolactonase [Chitinophagaceae bacterium]
MIREFVAGKLHVMIFENRESMGAAAADAIAAEVNALMKEKEEVNIIFAAAPSQNEVLAHLRLKDLAWDRINAFHMDEYVGLSQDAPQRFGNFLAEALFDRVKFRSVHFINGNAPDVDAECARYTALLEKYPADIVCLGIGENGHLAFNDPPVADFHDTRMVKEVALDLTCRQQQVNDGCFTELGSVPTHAITLTIPALMKGKSLHCVVPGPTKIDAVDNTIHREIREQYPSTILKTHARAALYLDIISSSHI